MCFSCGALIILHATNDHKPSLIKCYPSSLGYTWTNNALLFKFRCIERNRR